MSSNAQQNLVISTQPAAEPTQTSDPTHAVVQTHTSCCWGFIKKEWAVVKAEVIAAEQAVAPIIKAGATAFEQQVLSIAAALASGKIDPQDAQQAIVDAAKSTAEKASDQIIALSRNAAINIVTDKINALNTTDEIKASFIEALTHQIDHAQNLTNDFVDKALSEVLAVKHNEVDICGDIHATATDA